MSGDRRTGIDATAVLGQSAWHRLVSCSESALPRGNVEREKSTVAVAHAHRLRTAAWGEVVAGQRKDLFDPGLLTERERIWIGPKDAEQRFEKTPLAWIGRSSGLDLAAAIGVVARGQLLPRRCIAGGIPASLVLGKARLHLLNLRVKARALGRRRVEQKNWLRSQPSARADRIVRSRSARCFCAAPP